MEKFKLGPDERMLRKGAVFHHIGEAKSVMDALLGKVEITKCGAILTDKRFVVWEKPQIGYPFTPFVYGIARLIKGQPIRFSVDLERLAAIQIGPGMGFTLKSVDGASCMLSSDTLFDQRDKWVQAVCGAVAAACPARKQSKTDTLVEFSG